MPASSSTTISTSGHSVKCSLSSVSLAIYPRSSSVLFRMVCTLSLPFLSPFTQRAPLWRVRCLTPTCAQPLAVKRLRGSVGRWRRGPYAAPLRPRYKRSGFPRRHRLPPVLLLYSVGHLYAESSSRGHMLLPCICFAGCAGFPPMLSPPYIRIDIQSYNTANCIYVQVCDVHNPAASMRMYICKFCALHLCACRHIIESSKQNKEVQSNA